MRLSILLPRGEREQGRGPPFEPRGGPAGLIARTQDRWFHVGHTRFVDAEGVRRDPTIDRGGHRHSARADPRARPAAVQYPGGRDTRPVDYLPRNLPHARHGGPFHVVGLELHVVRRRRLHRGGRHRLRRQWDERLWNLRRLRRRVPLRVAVPRGRPMLSGRRPRNLHGTASTPVAKATPRAGPGGTRERSQRGGPADRPRGPRDPRIWASSHPRPRPPAVALAKPSATPQPAPGRRGARHVYAAHRNPTPGPGPTNPPRPRSGG